MTEYMRQLALASNNLRKAANEVYKNARNLHDEAREEMKSSEDDSELNKALAFFGGIDSVPDSWQEFDPCSSLVFDQYQAAIEAIDLKLICQYRLRDGRIAELIFLFESYGQTLSPPPSAEGFINPARSLVQKLDIGSESGAPPSAEGFINPARSLVQKLDIGSESESDPEMECLRVSLGAKLAKSTNFGAPSSAESASDENHHRPIQNYDAPFKMFSGSDSERFKLHSMNSIRINKEKRKFGVQKRAEFKQKSHIHHGRIQNLVQFGEQSCYHGFFILTYLAFPGTSLTVLRFFDCDEKFDGGEKFLTSDYQVGSPRRSALLVSP